MDESWIGKTTKPQIFTVNEENVRAFCTCLYDHHPLYSSTEKAKSNGFTNIIAPPTFPITWWPFFSLPWIDKKEVMIHAEQAFTYDTPLVAGDTLECTITLKSVRTKTSFQIVKQLLTGRNKIGLVFEAEMTVFIPLQKKENTVSSQGKQSAFKEYPLDTGPIHTKQLQQYAEISGDHQPIHLDPSAAKQAGFQRNIVHGMYMMGSAARLFHPWLDQAYFVETFDLRFQRPLLAGESLTLGCEAMEGTNLIKLEGIHSLHDQLILSGNGTLKPFHDMG